jgi:hypothetical protein
MMKTVAVVTARQQNRVHAEGLKSLRKLGAQLIYRYLIRN